MKITESATLIKVMAFLPPWTVYSRYPGNLRASPHEKAASGYFQIGLLGFGLWIDQARQDGRIVRGEYGHRVASS